MKRPQTSIAGLLIIVAGVAIVLGVLSQPWEQVANALLSLAVVAVPAACVSMHYGPDRWRAEARVLARGALVAALGLSALAVSLLAAAIVATAVLWPFDAVVLLAAVPTTLALIVAGCVARFGRGPRRACGGGALLFGVPALVIGLAPTLSDRAPALLTADAIHELYPYLYLSSYPEPAPGAPTLGTIPVSAAGPRLVPAICPSYLRFQRAGHFAIVLGVALGGGRFTRALAIHREQLRTRGDGPAPGPRRVDGRA
jgi:hypothetical protein